MSICVLRAQEFVLHFRAFFRIPLYVRAQGHEVAWVLAANWVCPSLPTFSNTQKIITNAPLGSLISSLQISLIPPSLPHAHAPSLLFFLILVSAPMNKSLLFLWASGLQRSLFEGSVGLAAHCLSQTIGHFSVLPLRTALAIWLPPLCQGKHIGVVRRGWFGVCFYWEQPRYLSLSILLSFARKEKTSPVHIKRVLEVFPSSHSDFKWSLRRQYTMEELWQKWQVRRSAREWHLTPEDEIWSILPTQDATVFRTVLKYECNLNLM